MGIGIPRSHRASRNPGLLLGSLQQPGDTTQQPQDEALPFIRAENHPVATAIASLETLRSSFYLQQVKYLQGRQH